MNHHKLFHKPFLGGPGTVLPSIVESTLGWLLAISCLFVSGYHYLVDTYLKPYVKMILGQLVIRSRKNTILEQLTAMEDATTTDAAAELPCWIPLMSYSRAELSRASPVQRFRQLERLLMHNVSERRCEKKTTEQRNTTAQLLSDNDLVATLRTDEVLRRLASLAMRPSQDDEEVLLLSHPLAQQLIRIWSRLLEVPKRLAVAPPFAISLIVPCYNESLNEISEKLSCALQNSDTPTQVQAVVVLAGRNANANQVNAWSALPLWSAWGNFRVVVFPEESGRGPCLNFGAKQACGEIYAFCHSDTRLPVRWDKKLLDVFRDGKSNSCAFRFGIDHTGVDCMPPGIRAVETTANLRCKLWSLPYGDQCLCLPALTFDHFGGFPHQCIMEDYELINLLRKRAALVPRYGLPTEDVAIVPGEPALCSPRRWQRFGVLYATYTNSRLVNLYASGKTPDEIYLLYYGQNLHVDTRGSPWEIELESRL